MRTTELTQKLLDLQQKMWNFAYKLTNDYNNANDLVQETSLKILSNPNKYTLDTNFEGWVYTIMRNLFINHCRKNEYREMLLEDCCPEEWSDSSEREQLAEENPTSDYDLDEIKESINRLPNEYQKVFRCFAIGYKYREIAEQMRLSIGTVKSRIFNSKQILQKALKELR